MFIHEMEEIEKKKAWDIYLVNYGRMTESNFKEFDYRTSKERKRERTIQVNDEEVVENANSFMERIGKKAVK